MFFIGRFIATAVLCENGGLCCFSVVFAETGLFIGFFFAW
jgi:hypothetical protein